MNTEKNGIKLLCVHVQVTQGQLQEIETSIFKQKRESWWKTLELPEQCKNMKVPPSCSHQSKKQTAISSHPVAKRSFHKSDLKSTHLKQSGSYFQCFFFFFAATCNTQLFGHSSDIRSALHSGSCFSYFYEEKFKY